MLIGLEVHCLHHHKIMPVNLGIGHPLLLLLLLLLLPLALLELGPLHAVTHLIQNFSGVFSLFLELCK